MKLTEPPSFLLFKPFASHWLVKFSHLIYAEMLFRILLIVTIIVTNSNAWVTVPSETKVSIYDFCSFKVPCAPGHLCHEGFCIQQQSFSSFPRSMYFRSLFRRR
ncbi:Late nodulin [Caenorhabditis elegans]|uniref:Late nodulin n=1 Tax=Caenorhabditis elegans TaxID=6239 RepID=Q21695_CAEEL|nr:Late nodulin [Caenorhabditis elegans]CCD62909.1 Late nodulin [Caenorhabditis elegans]|eukprot:NP_508097.1 Uncharacterized protein CELE_R04A9.1 [Caenorhabditis elegans]